MTPHSTLGRSLLVGAGICVGYFAAARLGLSLAVTAPQASFIWPASGIALAGVLLHGRGVWPAIWIGAFAANLLADEPVVAALGIAIGNTLEALVGATLMARAGGLRPALDRVRDVLVLAVGAAVCSALGASAGATTLCLGGVHPWSAFTTLWPIWWLGDTMGIVMVAPALLTLSAWPAILARPRAIIEAGVLYGGLVTIGPPIIAGAFRPGYALAYLVFPFLIWAALRFRQPGAALGVVVTSVVAIVSLLGKARFDPTPEVERGLMLLLLFLAAATVTALVLGALITERDAAERERAADFGRLKRAEEELRRSVRVKDEFLAILGHELRNPLVPIRNAVEVLRRRAPEEALVKQALEMMDRQVRHMVRLVDDLLDVGRIARGTVELRPESTDLGELAARAAETVRPLIENRRHRLTVSLPEAAFRVRADPVRLEQVVINLLTNAAKYTEPGGEIGLAVERSDGSAEIRVRDNGIGIRTEMLDRVFDMFSRGDTTPGRLQDGLGIGLTLARDLVILHGGTITARSGGPGQGSEFVVRLPLR